MLALQIFSKHNGAKERHQPHQVDTVLTDHAGCSSMSPQLRSKGSQNWPTQRENKWKMREDCIKIPKLAKLKGTNTAGERSYGNQTSTEQPLWDPSSKDHIREAKVIEGGATERDRPDPAMGLPRPWACEGRKGRIWKLKGAWTTVVKRVSAGEQLDLRWGVMNLKIPATQTQLP